MASQLTSRQALACAIFRLFLESFPRRKQFTTRNWKTAFEQVAAAVVSDHAERLAREGFLPGGYEGMGSAARVLAFLSAWGEFCGSAEGEALDVCAPNFDDRRLLGAVRKALSRTGVRAPSQDEILAGVGSIYLARTAGIFRKNAAGELDIGDLPVLEILKRESEELRRLPRKPMVKNAPATLSEVERREEDTIGAVMLVRVEREAQRRRSMPTKSKEVAALRKHWDAYHAGRISLREVARMEGCDPGNLWHAYKDEIAEIKKSCGA